MKKVVFIFMLSFIGVNAQADTQEVITDTTKNIIKFGKDFMAGFTDGVDEGRKGSEGADGAMTVTNVEEMEQYIDVEIIDVLSVDSDSATQITVGFKNKEDKPVRIANLDDKGVVLLIDSDGYSQELLIGSRYAAELTVPAKTGKKYDFKFGISVEKAAVLRLWSKEYPLTKAK